MQRRTGDFRWVQNTHLDHVTVGVVRRVEAVVALAFHDLVDHHAWLATGVGNDFAQWRFNRFQHEFDTRILVGVVALDLTSVLTCAQQGDATTRYNAFFNRSAGGVQRIFNACFLLFHFDFSGSAHLDQCHTAGQLGHALLQLLTVIVAGCFFDLNANLLHACLDVACIACAVDDDGGFFAHFNALGLTQVSQGYFFKRQANFFGNHFAAGQDGDVFQHGFAAIAEARCLNGNHLQDTADGVNHQRREGFAIDVFSNDQQRTA